MSCSIDTKLVAAWLLFQVEQVDCWKDCETAAMHVALCHCERCNSLKFPQHSYFLICSLTSWIIYSMVAIQATPWKVQCWVAVSLYHDVPCKVVFTLPVAEFIGDGQTGFAPWNHFNRYWQRTMCPPAIQWFCGIPTQRSCAAVLAAWKIVWWAPFKTTKNCPIKILTFVFSHIMSFHGFSWFSLEFDWLQIDLSMAEVFPWTMPEKLYKQLQPQGTKSHRFVEHKQHFSFLKYQSTWEN